MEARAKARYVRVTPRKARRVVDLIRGKSAAEAQAVLRFAPQAASEPVGKVLNSAIATTSAPSYWTIPFPTTVTSPTGGTAFNSYLSSQLRMIAFLAKVSNRYLSTLLK